MHYNLALIGFGNVGRALARLLLRKQNLLKSQYDATFSFTGISTGRHGFAVNPNGLDIEQALGLVESGKSIFLLSTFDVQDSLAVIQHSQADVMFENSPVNTQSGQPALNHIRTALELGMHAITANKGPVVHGYRELTALAKSKGKTFAFESTVLGGSPVFSVFRETFPLAELSSFKGILNATTNIILSRMESGESYEDAVKYCQSVGVAETDPTNDVDGWDAAIKVASAQARGDLQFLLDATRVKLPLARSLAVFHEAILEMLTGPADRTRLDELLKDALSLAQEASGLARRHYPDIVDPVSEAGAVRTCLDRLEAAIRNRIVHL